MPRMPEPSRQQRADEEYSRSLAIARPMAAVPNVDGRVDISPFVSLLRENRAIIIALTLATTLLSIAYAVFVPPTYESNILIQLEENQNSANSLLESVQQMFDTKSAASDEVQIISSRLVLSPVVKKFRLDVRVEPRYFPIIGRWIALQNHKAHKRSLSDPGLFGFGGFVWGAESAEVGTFELPPALYGRHFKLVAQDGGRYRLIGSFSDIDVDIDTIGTLGKRLTVETPDGPINLVVTQLAARPGAAFRLTRVAVVTAIDDLQKDLQVTQPTKDSDVIQASLRGDDPQQLSTLLNAIGEQYVAQDAGRRSAEAMRAYQLLNQQLPELERKLEESEDAYNDFRSRHMTLDPTTADTNVLQQSVDAQNRLAELEQKRSEYLARFTAGHPAVVAVDGQIAALRKHVSEIEANMHELPELEQVQVRLQRDVQVNTDLYTSLLNNLQQLNLVRATKGNARLVDRATEPDKPVKPKRKLVVALAAMIGICAGITVAWLRRHVFGGINQPSEIEAAIGLPVVANVWFSREQMRLDKRLPNGRGAPVLAHLEGDSLAVDSLRSLRTVVRAALSEAHNNVVLISGAEPNVGKSFVCANLAVVLAASHQRVLLIDADMRRGDLHRHFNVGASPGLSELIDGELAFEQAVHRNVLHNLDLIVRGSEPTNPSELLIDDALGDLLRMAQDAYDVVLIDSPAVLPVDDAATLGQHAGIALLVARQSTSTVTRLNEAVKRLGQLGIPLRGVVLNAMQPDVGTYGYGGGPGKSKAGTTTVAVKDRATEALQ